MPAVAPASDARVAVRDFLSRVRAEYREMPGLVLTRSQARRLWHLDERTCDTVLHELVHDRFLEVTAAGAYIRADANTR